MPDVTCWWKSGKINILMINMIVLGKRTTAFIRQGVIKQLDCRTSNEKAPRAFHYLVTSKQVRLTRCGLLILTPYSVTELSQQRHTMCLFLSLITLNLFKETIIFSFSIISGHLDGTASGYSSPYKTLSRSWQLVHGDEKSPFCCKVSSSHDMDSFLLDCPVSAAEMLADGLKLLTFNVHATSLHRVDQFSIDWL